MQHYTIDLYDGSITVKGNLEITFDSPLLAREEAIRSLGVMAEDTLADEHHRVFRAVVHDGSGQVVYEASLTLQAEWKVAPSG